MYDLPFCGVVPRLSILIQIILIGFGGRLKEASQYHELVETRAKLMLGL
jgi:hypothetical protein